MVPVTYFEVVSRQESIHTIPIGGDMSGASGAASTLTATTNTSATQVSSPESAASKQRISRQSNNSSSVSSNRSPLYGIVLYDFKAERPDELQANSGESIIVIAQSNQEWFVAKPIGRLGGPGLIPISYVQIREVGSDKPVEDVQAAIRAAGVPKVEEWKRMAAEYKASSIPLGKFDDDNAASAAVSRQLKAMSLQRERHRSTNTTGSSTDEYGGNAMVASNNNGNGGVSGTGPGSISGLSGSGANGINSGVSTPINGVPARNSSTPYHVVNASVDRYAFDGGRYWYLVVAELSNGKFRNLCRYYQDFYDFQIKLLDEFPDEAGRTGKQRTLPFMPGPLTYVNDSISSQRRANLDDYVRNLVMMPGYVSRSPIVQQLFALRTGDVETPYKTNIMPQPPSRESGHDTVYDSSQYDANGVNGGSSAGPASAAAGAGAGSAGLRNSSLRNSELSNSTHGHERSIVNSYAGSVSSQDQYSQDTDSQLPHLQSQHSQQHLQHQQQYSQSSQQQPQLQHQDHSQLQQQYQQSSMSHNPSQSQSSQSSMSAPLSPLEPVGPRSHSRMASESTVTGTHRSHQRQQSSAAGAGFINSNSAGGDDTIVLERDEHPDENDSSFGPSSSSVVTETPAEVTSIKVKVFYQDDLIAIKLPSNITFASLHERISQRLGLDNPTLMYKDADDELNEIADDDEFHTALGNKTKLVLYAR
ncbi:phosphatidylinositol-3-phosphate-binding protein BEM1 [Sugiyamaella lignohabitans]|uniref:Phosphatidylinositol-3-phosphate-binding protein BEM1 n=1 Tax=Sugiyamaella lignohabitans TaxID=796027 RepID=A0A167F5T3_9ASCO|nr:phosphatidylinositol-3-phosphate-binding protein BEM1 [Sugiyamaella lignohabitans]ANB14868.1 phosphatidylinositol-3-phosphate-binding protein BEM1 [Sugiyamaella lignohabitans]